MPLLRAGCREAKLPHNEMRTRTPQDWHLICREAELGTLLRGAKHSKNCWCRQLQGCQGAPAWDACLVVSLIQRAAQSSLSSLHAPGCREAKLPNDEMRKANRGLGRRNLVRNAFRAGTVRRWSCCKPSAELCIA